MNFDINKVFEVTAASFETTALEVFAWQYQQVEIYRLYCDSIRRTPQSVNTLAEIPFLPIDFFKSHEVICKGMNAVKIFESSGTTGQVSSKHLVADLAIYEQSFKKCFKQYYGDVKDYVVLAMLPSYLERGNSSLVYMAQSLIEDSGQSASGFFLSNFEKLFGLLKQLKDGQQKVLLLGVTFALLDFADVYQIDFPDLIVMETGGMKGRREELTRQEIHEQLKTAFGVKQIHSEYGMTELLSQGYSNGNGVFTTPAWMKVLTRDVYDPFALQTGASSGAVNIIDLANVYSCSFIATGDLAKIGADGSFEILGRIDNAELRGCNLMMV